MNQQFPRNIKQSGPSLTLLDYYKITLGRLGYAVSEVPRELFFTFAGDLLGSSGEHYEKGTQVRFHQAVTRASHAFSDDFMESLAMALMLEGSYPDDPESLMRARDDFYKHLESHFEKFALTYSPWFKQLFDARSAEEFLKVTSVHASCGAAMRAGTLGAIGVDREKALPLFLLSHAHAEALEGAYMVYGFVRAAAEHGDDFDSVMRRACEDAEWGREQARAFLRKNGLEDPECPTMHSYFLKTQEKADPYATIESIEKEGIETRFVVPAALMVVEKAIKKQDFEAVKLIVEQSLLIGGDPDTICSIAMGLYGAMRPQSARENLGEIILPHDEKQAY